MSKYFCYFVIISPWKRTWPIIWTNLNSLHPRMLCAKLRWNWPCGSGEFFFLNFINIYLLFHNCLPLRKVMNLHSNLNSHYPRLLWAKFGWNWPSGSGIKFFKHFVNDFSLLFPLRKGHGPSFEKIWIPFTLECFVPSLIKLAKWVWRRRFLKISFKYFHYSVIISAWKRM